MSKLAVLAYNERAYNLALPIVFASMTVHIHHYSTQKRHTYKKYSLTRTMLFSVRVESF